MGLTISCDKKSETMIYGTFHALRVKLAIRIGIDLDSMEGFSKKHPIDKEFLSIGYMPWNKFDSPLIAFLNQKDHDGRLTSTECKSIVVDLQKIIEIDAQSCDYFVLLLEIFIESVKTGKDVEWSLLSHYGEKNRGLKK